MVDKQILDMCCGSKMFWFDKNHPDVLFGDIRTESHTLCDGRALEVSPDMEIDFTDLPFPSDTFSMVVFDPPHLNVLGKESWMAKKYGVLKESWPADIEAGFKEGFRVLKAGGFLIFKWNETQIKVSEILKLTPYKPLFGHISGKRANTHWICFAKPISPQPAMPQPETNLPEAGFLEDSFGLVAGTFPSSKLSGHDQVLRDEFDEGKL